MSSVPVTNSNVISVSSGETLTPDSAGAAASQADHENSNQAVTEHSLFTPPIDIYETATGLVLIADLPGVTVKSLELQVQDNRLTLLGRVAPSVAAGTRVLHREYEEGDFLRSFILSEDVDHERVVARLNNGVLEIVLPKAAKSPPRRIQVKSE